MVAYLIPKLSHLIFYNLSISDGQFSFRRCGNKTVLLILKILLQSLFHGLCRMKAKIYPCSKAGLIEGAGIFKANLLDSLRKGHGFLHSSILFHSGYTAEFFVSRCIQIKLSKLFFTSPLLLAVNLNGGKASIGLAGVHGFFITVAVKLHIIGGIVRQIKGLIGIVIF